MRGACEHGRMDDASDRTVWIVAGIVAGWNVLQNTVPRRVYGWLNLVGSAVVVGVVRPALGLGRDDLGLGPGAIGRGGRTAAPLAAAVVGGVAVAASSSSGRRLFRDERVERRGPPELAKETLFRIPIGTALFEELLFRGLLQGWASRRLGERRATVVSSAAFGLWHVIPTLQTLSVYRSGRFRDTRPRTIASVAVSVLGTAAAGAAFALLGRRARSVLAPALLHGVINSSAYLAAWVAAEES